MLSIPAARRQTRWLFRSVAEDLNSRGYRQTTPGSGQSGTRTRGHWIASSTRWPLGHAASHRTVFWSKARYWLTHGHTQKHTDTKWCLPCFTRICPYCSIGVCNFSIQARALALFYTHVAIQPLSLWTVAAISTGWVTLSLVTVNISARQGTRWSTLVILEPSRTLQSCETKVARLNCALRSWFSWEITLSYYFVCISICFLRFCPE